MMTPAKLKDLQQTFLAADAQVRRGPIAGRIVRKPDCQLQVGGTAFPVWVGELGPNPLPDGEVVSRYMGSSPDQEFRDEAEAEQQGAWLVTGPVAKVIRWYQAWLALLDGEEKLRRGE